MIDGRLLQILVAVVAASTSSAASAGWCLNPLGCEPTTYQECVQQAAESKTDAAAKALISECARFKVTQPVCEVDARSLKEEAAHPNKRVIEWRGTLKISSDLDDYQALGVVQSVIYPTISMADLATEYGVTAHPDRYLCQRFHAALYK